MKQAKYDDVKHNISHFVTVSFFTLDGGHNAFLLNTVY